MDRRGFFVILRIPEQALTVVKLLTGLSVNTLPSAVTAVTRSCSSIVAVNAVSPLWFHRIDGRRVRAISISSPTSSFQNPHLTNRGIPLA